MQHVREGNRDGGKMMAGMASMAVCHQAWQLASYHTGGDFLGHSIDSTGTEQR